GSRDANSLVLYNKYFGTSTQTNTDGTEIRLIPLENSKINSKMKFLVQQKIVGVGNMNIGNDWVLSGNGTSANFLNDNVSLGDTVELKLGTSPERGNVSELIGGWPILIINGQKPPSWPNADVHPRTAVGFNRDSTKVFFVTVDGRQPGFSVGVSFDQLADIMLSIGCYQAVNLDGGGSTTMVVRGAIKNRPSDAGGERSVGNALLAVCLASTQELIDSLEIGPENILIDSSQTKKINIKGIDKWGFPIEVSPSELTWEIIGINGIVDTAGFFVPLSTGSGKIVGKILNLSDTISVTVISSKIPTWTLSAASGNLPSWFSPSASTERGLAYGKVGGNDRVYVVSRPNVHILNSATGDKIGQLSITGISGGTFTLNDVEVSSDGIIFGCNLTTAPNTDAFKIYKWSDESSTPQQVISFSGTTYRLGDKFTVVGSVNDNSAVIYAAGAQSNKVFKWTMSNGNFIQTPTEITLSDITSCGYTPSVAPKSIGNSNFFLNGHGIYPKEYSSSGLIIGTAPSAVIPSGSNSIRYFEKGGKKFIVTYVTGFGNENARVLDITNGISNAVLYETTPTLGSNANSVGLAGDVAVRHFSDRIVIIYVLATNNGIGAYSLSFDSVTTVENNFQPTDFYLYQNFPNPFNSSTTIKYSIPKRNFVTLKVFDTLGREIVTLLERFQEAGTYSVEFQSSNSKLSSGIYFYQLKTDNYTSTKKFVYLK
ncbi:MAG: phosphodiester glycosidase family protein, partial [Ignavibacteria bacterium]|nr:phosphodiester glycosidase family protein [Ignavibacteria bacterium]